MIIISSQSFCSIFRLLNINTYLRVILLSAVLSPACVFADDRKDDDFEQKIYVMCRDTNPIHLINVDKWTIEEINRLGDLCLRFLLGGGAFSSDLYISSSNLGSSSAQGSSSNASSSTQISSVQDRIDDIKDEKQSRGGWGLLLAPQIGETDRIVTDLESGYSSELESLVLGIDYRFNNAFVLGIAAGDTDDTILFDGNQGRLASENSSYTLYFTLLPAEGAYIDGYLGKASLKYDSQREINFLGMPSDPVSITNTAAAKFEGSQDLYGLSAGYDWSANNFSIGPFVSISSQETIIDAYEEDGGLTPTGMELRMPTQTVISKKTSIGSNLSYSIDFAWGAIVPSLSMEQVHESKNNSRSVDTTISALPSDKTTTLFSTLFSIETDKPDRDYGYSTVSLVAAMNSGAQFFLNYELMSGHQYFDAWAMSVGLLVEF